MKDVQREIDKLLDVMLGQRARRSLERESG